MKNIQQSKHSVERVKTPSGRPNQAKKAIKSPKKAD